MAIKWHNVIKRTLLRINALTGATSSALETTFTGSLDATKTKSAVFPFTSVVHAVVTSAGQLAEAIASTSGHPARAYLAGTTGNLAGNSLAGVALPTSTVDSIPIIGIYGEIRDAASGRPMTKEPLQRVINLINNPNGCFKGSFFHYAIQGNRLYHTRSNAVIDVCCWNEATQISNATANTPDIPLPDSLSDAIMAGALRSLARDDEFADQSRIFSEYFAQTIQLLRSGQTVVAPFAEPSGTISNVEG